MDAKKSGKTATSKTLLLTTLTGQALKPMGDLRPQRAPATTAKSDLMARENAGLSFSEMFGYLRPSARRLKG